MQMHKRKNIIELTKVLVIGGISEYSIPSVYYAGNSKLISTNKLLYQGDFMRIRQPFLFKTKQPFSVLNQELTLEETIKEVASRLQSNKHTHILSTYSPSNIKQFKGAPMDITFDIYSVTGYIAFLHECEMTANYHDLPKQIVKDLQYAHSKDILCFYLTVVLNMLLRNMHKKNPQMVQGFFSYDSTSLGINESILSTGIHCFTTIDDGVIDVCFYAQNTHLLAEEPAIIGEVPEQLSLYGWQEPQMTEEMYIEMFSKKNHKKSTTHFKYCHIVGYQNFLLQSMANK